MADWDEDAPLDTDFISQFPANERAARGVVKSVFGIEHHDEDDANQGKHEGVKLLDQSGDLTLAAGETGVWNSGGALRSGVDGASYAVFSHVNTQIFTSSDTWTKPTGLKKVRVTVIGGGGGGQNVETSGSGNGAGAGGGSGGYSYAEVLAANLLASETVTVGAAGVTTGLVEDTAGGNSAFGGHALASGAGQFFAITPRNTDIRLNRGSEGGSASAGDINVAGTRGYGGQSFGSTKALAVGGHGANSLLGNGGGGAHEGDGAQVSLAGTGFGAGGGGGAYVSTQRDGSNGSPGVVIVQELF